MDITHFHLVVNHVALFFIPLGLFFYFLSKDLKTQRLALGIVIVGCLFTFVASQSGEGAEEQSASFNEKAVENHEEASKSAQVISALLLVGCLISLFKMNSTPLRFVTLSLGVVATLALGATAYQGGQIRHGQNQLNSPTSSTTQSED